MYDYVMVYIIIGLCFLYVYISNPNYIKTAKTSPGGVLSYTLTCVCIFPFVWFPLIIAGVYIGIRDGVKRPRK